MISFKNYLDKPDYKVVSHKIHEAVEWHQENEQPFNECVFRVGSEKYFEFYRGIRTLVGEGKLVVDEATNAILNETDLGEFAEFDGQIVPLDCPMIEEEQLDENDTALRKKADKSGVSFGTLKKVYKRGVAAWNSGHRPGTTPAQWGMARVNSYITKGKTYHTADKDLREEKDVELNKPKRGGPKKFYVYVKDPKTGNVKKVTWGDTSGLKAKIDNPEARKSFAARHKCSTRNDKTTPSYWACRLPRYAKQLGMSGGGAFFW